jgi:hypothetical protein
VKVFIAFEGAYSDRGVSGVYSTRELAGPPGEDEDIEEYEVDEFVGSRQEPAFWIRLDKTGQVVGDSERSCLFLRGCRGNSREFIGYFEGESPSSREEALKLAAEARQAWLRERGTVRDLP